MPDVGGIAGDRLKSFIERIERLEEEKRGLATDIKEVYAEAKGSGFDTKIMRLIVKERRMDKDDLEEQQTLLDLYRRALGMLADTPLGRANEPRASRRQSFEEAVGDRLIDALGNRPGDHVEIHSKIHGSVRIRNQDGKKTVEPIGAET